MDTSGKIRIRIHKVIRNQNTLHMSIDSSREDNFVFTTEVKRPWIKAKHSRKASVNASRIQKNAREDNSVATIRKAILSKRLTQRNNKLIGGSVDYPYGNNCQNSEQSSYSTLGNHLEARIAKQVKKAKLPTDLVNLKNKWEKVNSMHSAKLEQRDTIVRSVQLKRIIKEKWFNQRIGRIQINMHKEIEGYERFKRRCKERAEFKEMYKKYVMKRGSPLSTLNISK